VSLPRSGVELIERIAERWRWLSYRVRFHPFTTNELPRLLGTINEYVQLTRLDRPIGIWLLLWPTLWGLWIAGRGRPSARLFIIFVVGTVLMRSAGCAVNDYADRRFDPHVERTKKRPLAAGRITPTEALVLFAALALTALALVLQLNNLTLLFALAGAALAVSYPFVKRFLSVPQMYLGVTFGWGIPMSFAAQLDGVPRVAWLLLLANMLWVTVYDTIYAMVDRNDDLKIGVRSTAILFGDSDRQAHHRDPAGDDVIGALPGRRHDSHGALVLRRTHFCRAILHLPLVAHPRSGKAGLLPRLPKQPLRGLERLPGDCVQLSIRPVIGKP
jgi:4-hydroxybenzoate polyprenyltransferase